MTGHILRCNNSDIDDDEWSKLLLSEEQEEVDTLFVDSETLFVDSTSRRRAESKLSLFSRLLCFLSVRLVCGEEEG